MLERYDRFLDPGTPPAEVADLLSEHYDGQPVSSLLADRMLANGSSPERLADVAEVMLAGGTVGGCAADPSVPAELAARAAAWREHIHYGLWRIDGPGPPPGLWCTDITSGVTRYAEFPAELTDMTPRWAVWLGGIVPVDGIWRSTGQGFRLSPAEGDAAAELVQEAAATLIQGMAGKPKNGPSRLMTEPLRFGQAEPLGVYVDFDDPASSPMAVLLGKVTGVLLPRIVAEVHLHRSPRPRCATPTGTRCA